jgi:hypothetical protein
MRVDQSRRIVFRQYYANHDLLADVLRDISTYGVGAESSSEAVLQTGYQPVYSERLGQKPVERERFLSVLAASGPEAIVDASWGSLGQLVPPFRPPQERLNTSGEFSRSRRDH